MAKSHPEVTVATAKELYANAMNCAFPDCDRPLYRANKDGSRTLNSRIAHIHARQENGPRWEPEMSAEANRSVANLLLLCIEHADEVDQPQRVDLYPPAVLQEWKRQQIAFFDSHRTGWEIGQDEAEEVIRASTGLEISILGETLNLGGVGGQAPGAGGGGGAAIGHGAKGGMGGPGGPIRINLKGQDGTAPGAGGGGAGYIDPDSPLLWHGGGQMPTFGESTFVGVDGPDGGDTTLGPFDDGYVLRAKGGPGAKVGSGNRYRSDKIAASSLMLANYVEFRGVFAYITGSGFQFYDVLNLQDRLRFTGIVVLECGGVPAGEYALTVEALDPENIIASSVTLVFKISQAGDMLRISCSFGFEVTVSMFGMWTIVARHEDRELARLPIVIKRGVPS